MCYTVAQLKMREYKYALRNDFPQDIIDKLFEEWKKLEAGEAEETAELHYRVSGFVHPDLVAITPDLSCQKINWGLIPSWIKSIEEAKEIREKTLNARGETIFEKPAFRESAKTKRCLILVDGFYEYHHLKGKTFPFYIQHIDQKMPFVLGGIFSEWADPDTGEIHSTTSIVTTTGNKMMTRIHNNPKNTGPRMPLILEEGKYQQWLKENDKSEIEKLIKPFPDELMKSFAVGKMSGKNEVPDSPESQKEVIYTELNEQSSLF
ncbi:MAG: SOS response-associated peptidase [Crocinitomicaceae bacterium]|nr:SOS response-associated peptidase [Crocinitomicaceae bacterium]